MHWSLEILGDHWHLLLLSGKLHTQNVIAHDHWTQGHSISQQRQMKGSKTSLMGMRRNPTSQISGNGDEIEL
jgi:hypothetical protein